MLTIIKKENDEAKEIATKIQENDGYCICAAEKTDDTKCMCKDFREQKEVGECHCGLYEKVEEDNRNITTFSHLKRLMNSLEKTLKENGAEDMEIPFEYLIGSCFPTCLQNIQNELKNQYTLGYLQGKADTEANMDK